MVAPTSPAALALAGATLFALAAPAPALAAPVVLKPASNWNVDYGAEVCSLIRVFGEEPEQHILSLRQYWPGESFGMTVGGRSYRKFGSRTRTKVRFADGQEGFEARPFAGKMEGYGAAVIFSEVDVAKEGSTAAQGDPAQGGGAIPMLDISAGAAVRFVELQQGAQIVRLETGPMAQAFKVMNDCTASLVKEWGLDPERLRTAQNRPRWLNRDALVQRIVATYPGGALLSGEQGIMRMRVMVNAQGTVDSCTIIKATNTSALESPACEVMKQAKFDPARDATGAAMPSYYATSITYQIN